VVHLVLIFEVRYFFRFLRNKLPRRYLYSACESLLGPTFGSMFCSWIFIQDAAALSWGDADAVHALCKKHFGTTHVAWQGRVANVATGSLLGTVGCTSQRIIRC